MSLRAADCPIHTLNLVQAIAWSLSTVSLFLTIGRFVIHWRKGKSFIWDDVFNALAVLFLFAFTGTYQVYGPNKYNSQLYESGLYKEKPVFDSVKLKRYNDAAVFLFWCVIYTVKASFLALYWMLFHVSGGRKFRIGWWSTTIYTMVSFVATIMWGLLLKCAPDKWEMKGKLDREHATLCARNLRERVGSEQKAIDMQIAWCVFDLVGDVLRTQPHPSLKNDTNRLSVMALPIAMLRPLRMRIAQKVALGVIFGLVLINMVFEVLRTILVIAVDLQRFQGHGVLCFILQATMTVIVCTLPCYRGLLLKRKKVSNWSLPTIPGVADPKKHGVVSTETGESHFSKQTSTSTGSGTMC